jgi:iron uptake system component EfeO
VNLYSPVAAKAGMAAAAAVLAAVSLTSCTAKDSKDSGAKGPAEITVKASDTTCELSGTAAKTGPSTFVITNNGSKVTEFYVYGEGERVMGEVENISPGLQRKLVVQLTDPG